MLKKYIDSRTVKDVPQNGIITVEIENEKGEVAEVETGISNLPLAFEKDIHLANRNGYYEYIEDDIPEYDENTEYITYEYLLEGGIIKKVWTKNNMEVDDE